MNGDWQNHRVLMAIASLALMVGVVMAGLMIMPRLPGTIPADIAYVTLGSLNAQSGEGPIFTLGDDLFPHQCGKARLTDGGKLSLVAYADPTCYQGVTTLRPYLLAADLRVPWAVVPQNERGELRQLAGVVMAQWENVGQRLLRSTFFEQSYAPIIKDILRGAFHKAWTAAATEQALMRAAENFDLKRLDPIMDGIFPLFLEKAQNNFWQALRGYTEVLFGGNEKANQEALAKLGAEVFADPRFREQITRIFPTLLTSREVMAVGTVMAKESVKAIIDDERLLSLVGRLLTDQRFLSLQPFSTEVEQFIRVVPLRLMRLRRRFDHNPLATYILRNMVRGRRGFLILLLNPGQEQQLANSDLPQGPALRRVP